MVPVDFENPTHERNTYGPWFDAAYYGECASCLEITNPGDRIRADTQGGYLCEECGEA